MENRVACKKSVVQGSVVIEGLPNVILIFLCQFCGRGANWFALRAKVF